MSNFYDENGLAYTEAVQRDGPQPPVSKDLYHVTNTASLSNVTI